MQLNEIQTKKVTRTGEIKGVVVAVVFETEDNSPPVSIQINMSGEKDTFYGSAHYDVKNKNLAFNISNQQIGMDRVREAFEIATSQVEFIVSEYETQN